MKALRLSQLIFGFVFLSLAFFGCFIAYLEAMDITLLEDQYYIFSRAAEGGASTSPVMIGLCALAGAALVINASRLSKE